MPQRLTDVHGARETRFRVPRWLLMTLTLIGLGCLAFSVVARQIARAAAAMPFALGAFDERFFWGPLVLGLVVLTVVAFGAFAKWPSSSATRTP